MKVQLTRKTEDGRDSVDTIDFTHRPVLLDECIEALNIRPDGIYVDGTAGGGGHSFVIASHLDEGHLIAIDQSTSCLTLCRATQDLL